MRIYTDTQADVHEGDIVRYVRYRYGYEDGTVPGKFYQQEGTVTELRPGAVGIHFPHYARGTNISAIADDIRLVACVHEKEDGPCQA